MKSLIPRTPPGKPKLKPRHNGPAYLPKHIYNMLSDDVMKELGKCNQEKKPQYKSTCPRMANVHEQDHDEDDHPDNPEPDLENNLPDDSYLNQLPDDSYSMQDSVIEELLETHCHYSAKTASTYHISKHSTSSYGSLGVSGANDGLVGADVCVLERTRRKISVTGIDGHELRGLDIVTCVLRSSKPTMARLTCSCMNMPIMAEVILFTPLVRMSDSTIHVMTNLIMLDINKSSHS